MLVAARSSQDRILNAPARALLQQLPRMADNPRVIPGMGPTARAPLSTRRVRNVARRGQTRYVPATRFTPSDHRPAGGHKRTTTTARCAHLSADPLRAANDAMGARIAAAMSRGMSATTLPSGTRPCHGCFRAHHRERQLYVDFVEEPPVVAASARDLWRCPRGRFPALRLTWRRQAQEQVRASPIFADFGLWRLRGTRLWLRSAHAGAIDRA